MPELLKNPTLEWDGKTEFNGADNRAWETPRDWEVSWSSDDPSDTPPSMFHKDRAETGFAFHLEHSYIKATTTFKQWVEMKTGFWYLIVDYSSDVQLENIGDAYWKVEFQDNDGTYKSMEYSVSKIKGRQSFAILINSKVSGRVRLRISYYTRWGSTTGAVRIATFSLNNNRGTIPQIGATLVVGKQQGSTTVTPPDLPELPEPEEGETAPTAPADPAPPFREAPDDLALALSEASLAMSVLASDLSKAFSRAAVGFAKVSALLAKIESVG